MFLTHKPQSRIFLTSYEKLLLHGIYLKTPKLHHHHPTQYTEIRDFFTCHKPIAPYPCFVTTNTNTACIAHSTSLIVPLLTPYTQTQNTIDEIVVIKNEKRNSWLRLTL